MRMLTAFLLAVLCHVTTVQAKVFSIDEIANLGLSKSKEVSALQLESDARRAAASLAGRWSNPAIDIGFDSKAKPGGDTRGYRIGISQPLQPFGLLSLKSKLARLNVESSSLELLAAQTELKFRLVQLSYELSAFDLKANHADERLARFKDILTYLRSRTIVSPQKRAEAAIVYGKIQVLQKTLQSLKSQRDSLWLRLNVYLGMPERPSLKPAWIINPPILNLNELKAKLLAGSPELKRLAALNATAELDLRIAEKERWPGVSINAGFGDSSGYDPERIYSLGLSIPIPVFTRGQDVIRSATLHRSAQETRSSFSRDEVTAKLEAEFSDFENASLALRSLPMADSLKQEKEMKQIDADFRRGQVDLLTYLEADNQHSEVFDTAIQVQLEFFESLTKILALIGDSKIPNSEGLSQ